MYQQNISMALCGLPWRRRRRTVPEASLAPGNGGGAQRLVEAPAAAAAALPFHQVVQQCTQLLSVCV